MWIIAVALLSAAAAIFGLGTFWSLTNKRPSLAIVSVVLLLAGLATFTVRIAGVLLYCSVLTGGACGVLAGIAYHRWRFRK